MIPLTADMYAFAAGLVATETGTSIDDILTSKSRVRTHVLSRRVLWMCLYDCGYISTYQLASLSGWDRATVSTGLVSLRDEMEFDPQLQGYVNRIKREVSKQVSSLLVP